MKVIIVTGTPGTGKTKIAKKISKEKKYIYLDVKSLIKKNKLNESYDHARKTYVVDTNKLNRIIVSDYINSLKKDKKIKGIVIDSHLSHYIPPKYVDLCIVTKCGLKKLKKRLEKRGYTKKKVRENLDCEIFDICLNEAKEAGHKIKVINT